MILVFLMWEYAQGSILYDIPHSVDAFERVNGGYKLIQKIEEKQLETSKEIYVIDSRPVNDHFTYYSYQFCLNRYKIVPGYPDNDCRSAIILSNNPKDEELLKRDALVYYLDENEWAYVIGDDWIEKMKLLEYKLCLER